MTREEIEKEVESIKRICEHQKTELPGFYVKLDLLLSQVSQLEEKVRELGTMLDYQREWNAKQLVDLTRLLEAVERHRQDMWGVGEDQNGVLVVVGHDIDEELYQVAEGIRREKNA